MLFENPQGQRSGKKCWSCARNKHKDCDLHMNDGAFDVEDFIPVSCGCICEGKIGTEFDSLLDMAIAYKKWFKESEDRVRVQSVLAARAASLAEDSLESIRAFLGRAYDDEGNIIVDSKRKVFERALGQLTSELEQQANETEAVFSEIVNGEHKVDEAILKMFFREPTEADLERSKPFWERKTPARDAADEAERQQYKTEEDFAAATYSRRKDLSQDQVEEAMRKDNLFGRLRAGKTPLPAKVEVESDTEDEVDSIGFPLE
jgi:hypothetical protein